ncbi:MAG TPA: hypothetical protein VHR66_25740 [Gemmataceae bacterium]|nr:hypothetical protein [Gemmataceae bacterium]
MSGSRGASDGTDWRINEVATEIVVTESVGSLSPEEVKRLVALVLEHVQHEQNHSAQRQRDTEITDRAYRSDVE